MFKQPRILSLAIATVLIFCFLTFVRADDAIERAGVVVGVTLGNTVFLPAKAISVLIGLSSGALSYLLTGGNAELTKQIWRDTTEGPYVITPELARRSVGERPELLESK